MVINPKLCGVWGQKLLWVMSTIGTPNTPSFIKIREVTLRFLGDLAWNDPNVKFVKVFFHQNFLLYGNLWTSDECSLGASWIFVQMCFLCSLIRTCIKMNELKLISNNVIL